MKRLALIAPLLALTSCSFSFLPSFPGGGAGGTMGKIDYPYVSDPTPLSFEKDLLEFKRGYSYDELKNRMINAQVPSPAGTNDFFGSPEYRFEEVKAELANQGYSLIGSCASPSYPYAIFAPTYRSHIAVWHPGNDASETLSNWTFSHPGNSSANAYGRFGKLLTLSEDPDPLIIKDGRTRQDGSIIEEDVYEYDAERRVTKKTTTESDSTTTASWTYGDHFVETEHHYEKHDGYKHDSISVLDIYESRCFYSYSQSEIPLEKIQIYEDFYGYTSDGGDCAFCLHKLNGTLDNASYAIVQSDPNASWFYRLAYREDQFFIESATHNNRSGSTQYDENGDRIY